MILANVDISDVLNDMGSGLLYGLVGLVLLSLGYLLIDVLTPGKLGHQLANDRNKNAGILVSSGLLSVGIIVTSAILAANGDTAKGLVESAGFGLVGLVLLGGAFVIIDVLTPGKLGDSLMGEEHEPLVFVMAASLISVGGIVAAAIS